MPEVIHNLSRMNLLRQAEGSVFGDVTYAPGGLCGPRVQQDVQIVLMYSPDSSVRVDDTDVALPAQSAALMRPGHREHFVFARRAQTHHRWCAIDPQHVPAALLEQVCHAPATLPLSPHLHGLIELGLTVPVQDASTHMPGLNALLRQLALTAIQQYLLEADMLGHRVAQPRAVRQAREFMEAHLTDPIRAADAARAALVTPQHLAKLFRTHLGITPARYLWQIRAKRGAELLTATGLSITEIAERCGFQNAFHFSRVIKAHYGCSPRAVRTQAWANIKL
jgi:AraC family transcriptional regulator of arabinose operon